MDCPQEHTILHAPLYGLVLAGGQSTRMGTDKSTLTYHGKSQLKYCAELLSCFCGKVFISGRQEQNLQETYNNYPCIHDVFVNAGPLGGILSAFHTYPHVAWLVLACDLPYVDHPTIKTLLQKRNPAKMATVYRVNNQPEPLCAIYEACLLSDLLECFRKGYRSMREILKLFDVEYAKPTNRMALCNVNCPSEYVQVVNSLQRQKGASVKSNSKLE